MRAELGALTHQGLRVECTLYHAGCIMLMLAHRGSMLRTRMDVSDGTQETGVEISWGLSPISRKPVDGFLKMPSLDTQRDWVKFVDWRRTGKTCASDLAVVIGALLPIGEEAADDFVNHTFEVGTNGVVSEEEMMRKVFPFLEAKCPDLCGESAGFREGRQVLRQTTPFMAAAAHVRMLPNVDELIALRPLSRRFHALAGELLHQELCHVIRTDAARANQFFMQARRRIESAVAALHQLAPKDDAKAIKAVASLLDCGDDEVRDIGFRALPCLASQGNGCAIAEATRRLQDTPVSVRRLAIDLLLTLALPGDEGCIAAVLPRAGDEDARVRATAAELLGQLPHAGHRSAIEVLSQLIGDDDPQVKHMAGLALPLIARGDAASIALFCQGLTSEDWSTRLKGIRGLALIAEKGDQVVLKALTVCLKRVSAEPAEQRNLRKVAEAGAKGNCRSMVKRSVLTAIGRVAERGDKRVLKWLVSYIRDPDCDVVEAAMRALARIVDLGDRRSAVRAITSVFDDRRRGPYAALRVHAVEVLALLAERGDTFIAKAIEPRFADCDPAVREVAVRTVGQILTPSDIHILEGLANAAKSDPSLVVKRSAARALDEIAEAASTAAELGHASSPSCQSCIVS